ncbi:hypothetical protein BDD12DRAFT_543411 [Trichophaea hybrida]|nr:hypothetical protein BDD12DRAFT_543411 [Trichophaea hybrida]
MARHLASQTRLRHSSSNQQRYWRQFIRWRNTNNAQNNWATKDLERIFSLVPPAGVKPASSKPVDLGNSDNGQKGKIIGGAVGGVLGFLLVVAIIWFMRSCMKTRIRHRQPKSPTDTQPSQLPELPGQYYQPTVQELRASMVYEAPLGMTIILLVVEFLCPMHVHMISFGEVSFFTAILLEL